MPDWRSEPPPVRYEDTKHLHGRLQIAAMCSKPVTDLRIPFAIMAGILCFVTTWLFWLLSENAILRQTIRELTGR